MHICVCNIRWQCNKHNINFQIYHNIARVNNGLLWLYYGKFEEIQGNTYMCQCSKLRVHSAPGAHISAAGRTFFGRVRPMCAHFFTQFSLQYTRGVHREIPGRTVSICLHPRGAQNKTLISNTDVCVQYQIAV